MHRLPGIKSASKRPRQDRTGAMVGGVLVFLLMLAPPVTGWAENEGATEPAVTHRADVFPRLWRVWPNKEGKHDAIRAWNEVQITEEELERMRVVFPHWKVSAEWTKEDGRHVPRLADFLRQRKWVEEPPPPAPIPPLRLVEASSFVVQPVYLAVRVAFALGGGIVGLAVWPVSQDTAHHVWETSFHAPWVWHEFVAGQ